MSRGITEDLEKLLYPGKKFSDYDVNKLVIEILPTGFPSMDDMMLFKKGRGELIIIGARPSVGKSALLVQLATNMAETGRTVLVTLEDGHEAIATRQTAKILNKGMDMIQRGLVHPNDLISAQEQIARLNMVIEDSGGLNVHQVCDIIRMQNKKSPLTAAFIDYVQIIKSDRKVSRAEDLGTISGELKALAKELCIPIVVASQLNRNSEFKDRDGRTRPPELADLKESGSLEQDADVAILIQRKGEIAQLLVAKNKNGPTGMIEMKYAGAQCRFIDLKEGSLE